MKNGEKCDVCGQECCELSTKRAVLLCNECAAVHTDEVLLARLGELLSNGSPGCSYDKVTGKLVGGNITKCDICGSTMRNFAKVAEQFILTWRC